MLEAAYDQKTETPTRQQQEERQGLKPWHLAVLNVAAEAATHKPSPWCNLLADQQLNQ
jgi:hypothetical protein